MNANELMLGDYVQNTNGNIGKVIGYTEYGEIIIRYSQNSTCFSDPNLLLPVPLTPEILEKNGFVPDNFSPYYLPIEDGSIRFSEHQYGLYCNILRSYQRYDGVCNYIHQLQHALRLCGIDKEITI